MDISKIIVDRDSRQRKSVGDTSDLEESMQRLGLIHPIVIEKATSKLIAGERRLTAAKKLGWTSIPCTFKEDLSEKELQLVELDENIRRVDLTWQEKAEAVLRYHEILGGTQEDTSKEIGLDRTTVTKLIQAAEAVRKGDERVISAPKLSTALNVVGRQNDRALASVLSTVSQMVNPKKVERPKPQETILNLDFCKWIETYDGPKFNLLHCDFPYGINHQKSEQGYSAEWGAYEDTPEVYWKLCETLLKFKDKILQPSAHVLFWFSMNYYEDTRILFRQNGFAVNPFPLVWIKSDSRGILPDPNRGPRRIYETALLMSLGDRKIVRPVDNAKAHPSSKELHLSEKPLEVTTHFLSMLVDEHTEVLDPTAGCANALRACKLLKAKRILGLEIDPEMCQVANTNFNKGGPI